MIAVVIVILPILLDETTPAIRGEVAVLDPTGEVADGLERQLRPESLARRRSDLEAALETRAADELGPVAGNVDTAGQRALGVILGDVPQLEVVELGTAADLEHAKEALRRHGDREPRRLALVVVHDDAVARRPGEPSFGAYDLWVREKLDDRVEGEIADAVRRAIVDARVRLAGLDREQVERLIEVPRVRSTTVTEGGEQETNEVFNVLLPAAFMVLLTGSVMTGGQYLMTTTIEEKASRVVEVLLSAVSPMELMTGKIIGQMGVGFVILGIYAGMGVTGLVAFALLGMVDLGLLAYLVVFYVIAYFVIASLMAAIGAAVNELREAQTLLTPVMVTLMVPWLLWLPITRNPDSAFAVVTSFLPPLNTFVMLLRMTSTTPPPLWQVWVSIAIGGISVWVALRIAAKVFRIGILMYGKPPSFATLLRWVRLA